jgi:hypothetical protein
MPAKRHFHTDCHQLHVWSLADMEHWSEQHHIAAVESFIKTESVTATQHGFQQQFQRCDAPSRNTLLLWVSKWCQVGSVKESKPIGRPLFGSYT